MTPKPFSFMLPDELDKLWHETVWAEREWMDTQWASAQECREANRVYVVKWVKAVSPHINSVGGVMLQWCRSNMRSYLRDINNHIKDKYET
jgi:hypothetical protein